MRKQSALLAKNFRNTFLSCERDQETIWKKLFIESKPYSDKLIRLLTINTKDCLDTTQEQYNHLLKKYDLKKLKEDGHIKIVPKFSFKEHEQVKSYILLEFDDFTPTENPQYRDCIISFTIICHLDSWELDDYKLRPHQIAGYIDGILNETKLSGIGTLQFMGASQIVFDENIGGIVLRYVATNGHVEDEEKSVRNMWPAVQDHMNM